MITLDKVRIILVTILGDKDPSLNLTVERFNELLNVCNFKQFKRKIGLPEEYQIGIPLPRQAFQITESNTQSLRPFMVSMGEDDTAPLWINDSGLADIPSDFCYSSIMSYRYVTGREWEDRPVEIVSDSEFQSRISDPIEFPDIKYPIANFLSNKIRFRPLNLRRVFFKYLKYPSVPFYSYKYNSTKGINVYDSATSTQFEWNDIDVIDIIVLILEILGVKMNSENVFGYANKVEKEGI